MRIPYANASHWRIERNTKSDRNGSNSESKRRPPVPWAGTETATPLLRLQAHMTSSPGPIDGLDPWPARRRPALRQPLTASNTDDDERAEEGTIYIYIYIYIYGVSVLHLGAFYIENAPTLVVFNFWSVAAGLTLVAIGSRRAAIGWSCYNCFVSSCNKLDLL
jgi:hypothetical protein